MNLLEAIELAKDYKAITGQAIEDNIIEALEYANELKSKVKRYFEIEVMDNDNYTRLDFEESLKLKDEIMKLVEIKKLEEEK